MKKQKRKMVSFSLDPEVYERLVDVISTDILDHECESQI